jgi:hypothetical protein
MGHIVDIQVDGTTVATYEWKGSLPTVRLGKWQIESESVSGTSAIQQTARGPKGKVIRVTSDVNGILLGRAVVLLDAVASEIGLSGQWQRGLRSVDADTDELDLGQNRSLKFHMRTISPGERVGVEDGTEKPLFWGLLAVIGGKH